MFESRFQSFSNLGGPAHAAARVALLREELERAGLTGFIVPRADEHQNEYVAPGEERLLWLTGFSGSAGLAIVLKEQAALFVDGRYTEQAAAQTDPTVFEIRHLVDDPPSAWLERNLRQGDRLGYDPRLHTSEAVSRFAAACGKAAAELVAAAENPIDRLWADRPAPPLGPVDPHKLRFAGETASAKLERVRGKLASVDGLLISDPHNLAWLLNIRGSDVAHTPLPLGYGFVPRQGRPIVFLDPRKLSASMRDSLAELAELYEPAALQTFVAELGRKGSRVLFDAATAGALLTQTLERQGGQAEVVPDPITLMKATKNKAELAGARAAHERDGAALARFLAWFDDEAPKGRLTEIDAAAALETFRRETGLLKDISFPTIAAAGPHAALPHYRVSQASNRKIGRGVFLIDSGAQYEDGTTDVTRTIALGRPTPVMRDRFTRVLKGHIAIAEAVFPAGTTGAQIDALARTHLWRAGLDFDHGTGHGVGSYLSVHEGPQRISKTGTIALAEGMIVSDEPGYYSPGAFGVRIENLLAVTARKIAGAERRMLGFETLTLAPIDLRLIDLRLMTANEIKWLNAYHGRVRQTVSPLLDARTRRWLSNAARRVDVGQE